MANLWCWSVVKLLTSVCKYVVLVLGTGLRQPTVSRFPLLVESCAQDNGPECRHGELLDIAYDLIERIGELFFPGLSYESIPLDSMLISEFRRERFELLCGYRRVTILECRIDGLSKSVSVKIEMLRADPDVVKVFHPAVGAAECHHGLKLFGERGFDRIGQQLNGVATQEGGVFDQSRGGDDDIADAEIDLNSQTYVVYASVQQDPCSLVLRVLP
jgi:hypothetical protein